MVIAKVGADGSISIRNGSGAVHVIVDIAGWYASPTETVTEALPQNTVPPAVIGSGHFGTNLSANPGTWTGIPTPNLSYQWYACESVIPTSLSTISNRQQIGYCQQLGLATKISAGNSESCAVLVDGRVQCWGLVTYGEYGPNYGVRYNPVDIEGITNAVSVSSGNAHSCALLGDGSIRCWGSDSSGRLGNSGYTGKPVTVWGISNATSISVGSDSSCAVLVDHSVKCWGANDNGELGNNSRVDSLIPVTVFGISDARSVAVGGSHACVITLDGRVKCWGYNANGALGNDSQLSQLVPVQVVGMSSITSISLGPSHSCALSSYGTISCWGLNNQGQLGNGTKTSSSVPRPVAGISTATSISAGDSHNCAIVLGGHVACWGANGSGRLGNGSNVASVFPVSVFGISTATSISVAGQHSCSVVIGGRVLCWGLAGAIGLDSRNPNTYTPLTRALLHDTDWGLRTGQVSSFSVLGSAGVPSFGVSAVALRVSILDASVDTKFEIYPKGKFRPIQELRVSAADTSPKLVIASTGDDGDIEIKNTSLTELRTRIKIEIDGFYTGDSFVPKGVSGFINATNSYISLDPLLAERNLIVRVIATNALGSAQRFSTSVRVSNPLDQWAP
jgi:alpha-tubulin suppressor-like RCC1 family protein